MTPPRSMFSSMIADADKGAVLSPLLRNYLNAGSWKHDLYVKFPKGNMNRKPDGWFHPSEHPLWTERQLYLYLTQIDLRVVEPLGYLGAFSVTMGTAVHSFIEGLLTDMGLRLNREQMEAAGFTVGKGRDGEPHFSDPDTNARGATDGISDVEVRGWTGYKNIELKTTNQMKMDRIPDMDVEAFRSAWPGYYAQQQEYLRMSGMSMSMVLVIGMGYPWPMKEFHVPFDPVFAGGIRDKYMRALEAAQTGVMPGACCAPGSAMSNSCPMRLACPIGRQS